MPTSCVSNKSNSSNPSLSSNNWSKSQDESLREALLQYGIPNTFISTDVGSCTWQDIAQLVPEKEAEQCRLLTNNNTRGWRKHVPNGKRGGFFSLFVSSEWENFC